MKKAVIFIGIQGSGKSTFYRERFVDFVHINLDTLHTRNREKLLLEECFDDGKNFVVDNTNPTKADRERYIVPAKEHEYTVTGYYFSSKISECFERNNKREGKARIPNGAIAATYNKLEIPSYDEGFDELCFVEIVDDKFVIKEWKEDEV